MMPNDVYVRKVKVLNKSISLFLISASLLFSGFTAIAEELPLSLGEHLAAQGNYDAAITEYKRFLFFHPDDARVGKVYYNIGLAYRAQGVWAEAVTSLRAATHLTIDAETKSAYQLELAVTLIAAQDYDLARLELIKVTMRTPSAHLYRRALFLQAVAYIYQFRWEDARESLRNYTTDERLEVLLDAAADMPLKSVKFAEVLSTIFPGAGQVYVGDWTDGLNALLLNGALGFVAVDAVLDGHYVDAALFGVFIFWRYYRGNTFRAGQAVERFNQQESRRAADAILQRLQEIVGTP
ncbi:tetratricopeptide repeat protein [Candidatus Poribacteria bacterium]|nr:tetratricopeptide repeat protein [Candidatus Poribacteria bacterium]